MPKFDHAAIQQAAVAHTDESENGRTLTQRWLEAPEHVDELLEAVSANESLRRFCQRAGIAYSSVQRALTGEILEERYRAAQEQAAEHLLGEMQRVQLALEGRDEHGDLKTKTITKVSKDGTRTQVEVPDAMDPKVGAVILANLQWRVTKLNQRRYSDRQVLEQHTFDHTKAHLEAVRQLARHPRALIEGQVLRPAVGYEAQPQRTPASDLVHRGPTPETVLTPAIQRASAPIL